MFSYNEKPMCYVIRNIGNKTGFNVKINIQTDEKVEFFNMNKIEKKNEFTADIAVFEPGQTGIFKIKENEGLIDGFDFIDKIFYQNIDGKKYTYKGKKGKRIIPDIGNKWRGEILKLLGLDDRAPAFIAL